MCQRAKPNTCRWSSLSFVSDQRVNFTQGQGHLCIYFYRQLSILPRVISSFRTCSEPIGGRTAGFYIRSSWRNNENLETQKDSSKMWEQIWPYGINRLDLEFGRPLLPGPSRSVCAHAYTSVQRGKVGDKEGTKLDCREHWKGAFRIVFRTAF